MDHDETPELERIVLGAPTVRDYLEDFASHAGRQLGGGVEVGVSLRHHDRDRLVATSSARAARCDEAEHAAQDGPCVAAMDALQVVLVEDILEDGRFPQWRRAALDVGYRSAAGIPAVVSEGVVISLNLYSEALDPWDTETLLRADVYAQQVAQTIGLCLEVTRLTHAYDAARGRADLDDEAGSAQTGGGSAA